MGRNVIETIMGAFVLFVALFFIFISYKSGNISTVSDGYKLTSKFRDAGGISIGSDVRVGGIKIGTVFGQRLDPNTYMAIVEININESVKLPKDSIAAIVGDGLLGGKYISIQPGGDSAMFSSGDEIKYTQDSVNIEQLIGKFAFGSVDGSKAKENDMPSAEQK